MAITKVKDYVQIKENEIKTNRHYDSGYLDRYEEIHIIDIFDNFLDGYVTTAGLDTRIVTLDLAAGEEVLYMYNPRALSTKYYGTPNMWELILRVNGLTHPGELDFKKPIKMIRPEVVTDFFNKIPTIKKLIGGQWMDLKETNMR